MGETEEKGLKRRGWKISQSTGIEGHVGARRGPGEPSSSNWSNRRRLVEKSMGGCCLCAWGEPALPLVSKANSEEEELVIELGGAKTSWNRPAPLYPSFSAFQTP